MKTALLMLNARAGTLASSTAQDEPTRIRERFARHDIDVVLRELTAGESFTDIAREARDSGQYDLIVAGGGDGTLNAVAAGLVGGRVPFGVLPLGTFNHLAKELGMPPDLDAAVDALVDGRTVPLNIGTVNGRPFLLFAAIGLYAEMIRHRDAQRRARGRRKMWAGFLALLRMLLRWRLLHVRLRPDAAEAFDRTTPVVYVSVSDYQIRALGVDADSPDRPARDQLNVYLAAKIRPTGLLGSGVRWLLRRVRPWADFELVRTRRVQLDVRGKRVVRVGIDGEVVDETPPIVCRWIEGGLLVRVPR